MFKPVRRQNKEWKHKANLYTNEAVKEKMIIPNNNKYGASQTALPWRIKWYDLSGGQYGHLYQNY